MFYAHSGRAIDVYANGRAVLEEEFEATDAFDWLTKNAARFDFSLSYPRDNLLGIIFEPRHWFYLGD
ncbi:MAG: D-alanyl-D-alanine carboxypeptidase family protein [Pseudobdellovibrionaceae bacterium]